MNTLLKYIFLLPAAFLATGCSLLQPRREIALYAPRLSAATRPSTPLALSWSVEVIEPYALSPLSGTAIVVSPHPGELTVYGGVRWHEAPPLLLQALLVEGLRDAGISNAGRSDSLLLATHALESDLRAFEACIDGDGAAMARIRLDVRLIRLADGRALGGREVAIAESATSPAAASVAIAFERALDRLTREVANWAGMTLAGDSGPE